MRKGFFVAAILVLPFCQASSQKPVSFLSEYIDFRIENDFFSVNGLYIFLNRTDRAINVGILYPFALPADMVDSIGVMNLTRHGQVVFQKRDKDIIFNVSMNPHDTVAVHVVYRQPVAGKNSYILNSIRSWGDALEKAVYTLTTDKDLIIRSFSLPPDSCIMDSVFKTYYWDKENFEPAADFEIILDRQGSDHPILQ